MIRQSVARKLIRNYKRIDSYAGLIEKALCKDCESVNMLKEMDLWFEERKLRRLLNYIGIYKAIFIKNLENLLEYEKNVVTDHYIEKKDLSKTCMENYMGEVSVYRILRKFEYHFIFDISKTKRIIKYLLPLCDKKRRRV